jgi:thymidylate synthase ThyX
MPPLTGAERALLAPYVTALDSPVFVLKNLPEEVVAVLFAYYSRSRGDLRGNLLRLLQDQDLAVAGTPDEAEDEAALLLARQKAREFHEKWVVGYGHASVAEHAVAHVAVEDVSIIASKVIEDARLAAYTEKSTRYVPFPRRYYPAPELTGEAAGLYRDALEGLFNDYEAWLEPLTDAVQTQADRSLYKTDAGFRNACLAQACDALRYVLPAATCTNIGVTANARTLEGLITKMLSHPLAEVRETGERIKEHATRVIPTLIKYARPNAYRAETEPAVAALAAELLPLAPPTAAPLVRLVDSPPDAEARLAAAILYEQANQPYETVWETVRRWDAVPRRRVIAEYLARRRRYGTEEHGYTDPPLRNLEHAYFTFDVLVDYGAYRDIQRHRMATQTAQRLGCEHGYETPELLARCGFAAAYAARMEQAAAAWGALAETHPDEAQYVVPLAFRKRVLFTWNLRALHHFVSLRSARQGHISYRRVAWAVWDELQRREPFLAEFIRVDRENYELARPG